MQNFLRLPILPNFLCRCIFLVFAWKYSGRASGVALLVVLTVFIMFDGSATARSEMFACRDRSGKINYTNVRNSPNCTPLVLKKSRRNSYRSSNRYVSPNTYDRYIKKVAKRYGVDHRLIKAIIHTESNFDHRAVSHRGAQGLMQLMPATARELKVANPFNPRENIDGGTRYFKKMLNRFNNDLILSLAAYNAGPTLVKKVGGVPRIQETRRYVNKVLKYYRMYKERAS